MIMMIELHSFYFEFNIFQDSLFDKYILFLSSSVPILIRLFPFPLYHGLLYHD